MPKKLDFNTNVDDFIMEYPNSIDIFEELISDNKDTDHKDIKTLAKEKNILLDELKLSLEKIMKETPSKKTKSKLSNFINNIEKKHHAFLWETLPTSSMLLKELIEESDKYHREFFMVLQSTFAELEEALEKHLSAEEEVIFNAIRQKEEKGELKYFKKIDKAMLKRLKEEHKESQKLVQRLKDFTANFHIYDDNKNEKFAKLYKTLKAITEDLNKHITLEDSVLMPKIEALVEEYSD